MPGRSRHFATRRCLPPIEQEMWEILQDYEPHTLVELHACLHDDQSPLSNVHAHLTALRTYLQPRGMTIAFQRISGHSYYACIDIE